MLSKVEVPEKPILYSDEMVPPILAELKTCTRRVIKPQPKDSDHPNPLFDGLPWRCPYGAVGDHLWVREAWRTLNVVDHLSPSRLANSDLISWPIEYSNGDRVGNWQAFHVPGRVRPSIYLPRKYSRITLEITGIRAERLDEISHEDAIKEGIAWVPGQRSSPIVDFVALWESIHGAGSWALKPWVWVVYFKLFDVKKG